MNPRTLVFVALLAACSRGAPPPAAAPVSAQQRFPSAREIVVPDSGEGGPITPMPPLVYPVGARGMEVALGTLHVIDTAGRAEMLSVTFVTETPPMFRAAVCDFLAKARWVPVRRGNGPRRAVLVGGYVFTRNGGTLDGRKLDARAIMLSLKQRGLAAYVPELDTLPHCS